MATPEREAVKERIRQLSPEQSRRYSKLRRARDVTVLSKTKKQIIPLFADLNKVNRILRHPVLTRGLMTRYNPELVENYTKFRDTRDHQIKEIFKSVSVRDRVNRRVKYLDLENAREQDPIFNSNLETAVMNNSYTPELQFLLDGNYFSNREATLPRHHIMIQHRLESVPIESPFYRTELNRVRTQPILPPIPGSTLPPVAVTVEDDDISGSAPRMASALEGGSQSNPLGPEALSNVYKSMKIVDKMNTKYQQEKKVRKELGRLARLGEEGGAREGGGGASSPSLRKQINEKLEMFRMRTALRGARYKVFAQRIVATHPVINDLPGGWERSEADRVRVSRGRFADKALKFRQVEYDPRTVEPTPREVIQLKHLEANQIINDGIRNNTAGYVGELNRMIDRAIPDPVMV